MLHFGAGVLALVAIFSCGRRLGHPAIGILAISILMVPTPFCDVSALLGFCSNDLGVCWMTMTTVLLWLASREQPGGPLLFYAALCAGFAGSFKFPALSVGFALVVILALELRRQRVEPRAAAWRVLLAGAVALAPVTPWLYRNASLTGNPVYPMFSGLIPTRDWSPELARVFGLFFRYYNWGKASGERLGLAQRKEILAVAAVVMAAFLVTVIVRAKKPAIRDLLVFASMILLPTVAVAGLYFRFWLPALMCLSLPLAHFVWTRWPRAVMWPSVLIMAAAIGMFVVRTDRRSLLGFWRVAVGKTVMDEELRDDPLWSMWRYINANTPPDARVLFAAFYTTFGSSTAGAYWVDRACYSTDAHLQDFIHLNDWPSFLESISKSGIEYVLVSDREFIAGRHGFRFTAAQNEFAFARRLVAEFGTPMEQFDHLQLFHLRSIEAGSASR
jgi:hypothetical protein